MEVILITILFSDYFNYVREEIERIYHCKTEKTTDPEGNYILLIKADIGNINLPYDKLVDQYQKFMQKEYADDSVAEIITAIALLLHWLYTED